VIDISLELVLKISFIYKINQIDFAAIHAAISKCQIIKNKDVYDSTERIQAAITGALLVLSESTFFKGL
jgi:hypothetical protein